MCTTRPTYPTLILTDLTGNANFTTEYEDGDVIKELDFVTFSCPEGFYFSGTNDISVYATCHDWGWLYNYDPETFCRRKFRSSNFIILTRFKTPSIPLTKQQLSLVCLKQSNWNHWFIGRKEPAFVNHWWTMVWLAFFAFSIKLIVSKTLNIDKLITIQFLAVQCHCPPLFSGLPVGTYDYWDTQNNMPECQESDAGQNRGYKAEITYECPAGYMFDQTDSEEPRTDKSKIVLTCEWWNDWDPPSPLRCTREYSI